MKYRVRASLTVAALIGAALASQAPGTSAAMATPGANDAILDRAFSRYVHEHPGDWIGAADLVESLGGSIAISGDDGVLITPEAATAAFRSMDGDDNERVTPYAWPSTAFTVAVAVVTSGPTDSTVSIAGGWNWKDNFIGQGSPVDIASIMVNKSCGTWGSYSATTKKWNGVATKGRASLRSGGTGTAGPVWNIADGVSNFENQVDNGTVSAVYTRSGCSAAEKKSIQAEFVYEGNDGGSVVSVSAGWGGFQVSYSNPGASQTRSSGAETVPY